MMVNGLDGDGAVQNYFNDAMNQEMSYQTAGTGADTSRGGVRLNMIPREGGNRFSGSSFGSWSEARGRATTWTQSLRDSRLRATDKIEHIFNALNANPVLDFVRRSGATFMRPTSIMPPRIVEFSVSYTF